MFFCLTLTLSLSVQSSFHLDKRCVLWTSEHTFVYIYVCVCVLCIEKGNGISYNVWKVDDGTQNKRHILSLSLSCIFFHSHSFCAVYFFNVTKESTMSHPRFCWCDSSWANHFILWLCSVLLLLLLILFHFSFFPSHASQSVNSVFLLLRINLFPQHLHKHICSHTYKIQSINGITISCGCNKMLHAYTITVTMLDKIIWCLCLVYI